ncbi:DUF6165 family protein [Breoghania sp.]|uniref:DUF6165 family protein n=1 Tax=Breoghania sp. TaxID=2065378 RepID=UPI002AAB1D04|nr:DUF6165 family protein [Breoghania sp.]
MIKDIEAKANVAHELSILNDICQEILDFNPDAAHLKERLSEVNSRLWDIEDKTREKESAQDFDAEFIDLARSVYKTNDLRASLKRQINICQESDIIEEKSYQSY